MHLITTPKIAKLDFKNLISWDFKHINQADIIIADNFVLDPRSLRNYAMLSQYSNTLTDTGYKYNFSNPPIDIINDGLDLIGRVLKNEGGEFMMSYFVYETKEDEFTTRDRNWIHYDPWKWVGLHYLNLPEQCEGGTSFFIHKETETFGYTELNDFGRELIKKDGTIPERWIEYYRVDLKWNRLLLFRPCFFHSPSNYFGNCIENARLYQLFTFQ